MNGIIRHKYSSLYFLLFISIHKLIFLPSISGEVTILLWMLLPITSILGILIAGIQIYKKIDRAIPILGLILLSAWLIFFLFLVGGFIILGMPANPYPY